MGKRNLHVSALIGPGVAPTERAYVDVAPAYDFVDGASINWPVSRRYELVDGAVTITDMEDTYLGEPLTWAIRGVVENGRGGTIYITPSVTKQFPTGDAGTTVEYVDLVDVDAIAIPGYGPTWAEQARADAEAAEAARVAAVAAQAAAAASAASAASNYVTLAAAAKNPDLLIVGSITRNAAGVITSAQVVWPDGTAGTFTTDSVDTSDAINSYHITYGSPVTKTFTQPTITRDSSGTATIVPQIVVS